MYLSLARLIASMQFRNIKKMLTVCWNYYSLLTVCYFDDDDDDEIMMIMMIDD